MKKTLISIIAVISTALVFAACGNIEDDSNTEPKVTAADSSAIDSSTADTTASTKSATTTSISSADDSSSKATTTSIVTGTDKNGKVTTLIIGEGGKILSTSPNNKTTTKTTTKTTAKTTTKQVGSNNNNQNNGGNNNNNYNNNNNQNNYQPNSGGGNSGNQNSGGNNSPAPVQTNPPQTERKTTTTTQAPQTQPPAPVVTEKQFKDLSGLEKIENCGFDDLTKAYLKFGYGKKNVELSGYEWELIRQDIIDYGMENVNGQKDFYIDEFGGYTISFPYPIKLIVNSSYEGEEHAHYDASAHTYYYGGMAADILSATSENDLYNVSLETKEHTYAIWNQAIESHHTICESGNWFNNPNLAELVCTIEFNIGMMPDGGVWFLTE